MTDPTAVDPSDVVINLRRFALQYLLASAGIAGLLFVLSYFSFGVSSKVMIWAPAAIAAMMSGKRIAQETGTPLKKYASWNLAIELTLVSTALFLVWEVVVIGVVGMVFLGDMFAYFAVLLLRYTLLFWFFCAVGVLVLHYFANVFWLSFGLKAELKAQAKKRARAGVTDA